MVKTKIMVNKHFLDQGPTTVGGIFLEVVVVYDYLGQVPKMKIDKVKTTSRMKRIEGSGLGSIHKTPSSSSQNESILYTMPEDKTL